jgi:hypothetical protein
MMTVVYHILSGLWRLDRSVVEILCPRLGEVVDYAVMGQKLK